MKKVSLRHEQTIFPSTILEFTWLIIDGFMVENSLAPSLKRVTPNTESPKKFEIFSASTTWYSPITIGIIFLVWNSYSLFFICTGSFQVQPEKNHPHPNCQFPPKIPIWTKSLLYKPYEKCLTTCSPSITQGACELWNPSGYVNVYFQL